MTVLLRPRIAAPRVKVLPRGVRSVYRPRMPSVLVRPYVPADLERAAALWVAAWRATMPEIDFAARRGWIVERLQTQDATGTVTLCAVAADDPPAGNPRADVICPDGLCGFAMIEPARAYLEQLAVDPARFGLGIGTALLAAAKAICPDRLALRVNQDNPRAVRFYEREGFRITGEGVNPGGRLKTWDMAWSREA